MNNCLFCDKNIRNYNTYCSVKCQRDYISQKIVDNWLLGNDLGYIKGFVLKRPIRKYILKKSNFSCESCGWNKINPVTKRSPLEINHKDGNPENCHINNLEVLCPNCHSLTFSYKALNKGKGRTFLINATLAECTKAALL